MPLSLYVAAPVSACLNVATDGDPEFRGDLLPVSAKSASSQGPNAAEIPLLRSEFAGLSGGKAVTNPATAGTNGNRCHTG
jgi:hypothetical protein